MFGGFCGGLFCELVVSRSGPISGGVVCLSSHAKNSVAQGELYYLVLLKAVSLFLASLKGLLGTMFDFI